MKKILKRVLSILVVCSLVLTTNSIVTLADGLNSETSVTIETTETAK